MQGFRSAGALQRFTSISSTVRNLFVPPISWRVGRNLKRARRARATPLMNPAPMLQRNNVARRALPDADLRVRSPALTQCCTAT
jgi:hypothetical protein